MRQILLHPGFHKTGTSSMQHFLWANRDALGPYFEVRLMRHFKPVVRLSGMFSRRKNPLQLLDMVPLLDDCFAEFPPRADRDLLLSAEGLCGHLPGTYNIQDYSAVPVLMTYLAGYLVERFPDAQVKLLFTTRNSYDWLFSTYKHQLRAQRLTLDFTEFETKYKDAAQFDKVLQEVVTALAPLPVTTMPMSDALRHPLGPGAALVGHMDVPDLVRSSLIPVGKGNEEPSDALWAQFLSINRSSLPDEAAAEAKNALAKTADLGGWKPL